MKRLVLLTAVLLLTSFLVPVYADTWVENLTIGSLNVYFTENAVVTSDDDCPHTSLYQMSDIQQRYSYENATWHKIQSFYQIKCFDCNDFVREVTASETLEEHNFETTEFCDAVNNVHTYFSRCNKCKHETRTSVFCRGVHEQTNIAKSKEEIDE